MTRRYRVTVVVCLLIAVGVGGWARGPVRQTVIIEVAGDRYWPSIVEMQEWSGAKPDGIWGPETDRLYKEKWAKWFCDMCAMETWPTNTNYVVRAKD